MSSSLPRRNIEPELTQTLYMLSLTEYAWEFQNNALWEMGYSLTFPFHR